MKPTPENETAGGRKPAGYLPYLVLLLAAILLAAGILLGENGLVQRNAHYLCLECIGIG